MAAQAQTLVASDDLESGAGWTKGLPGDTATQGKRTLTEPMGSVAQPDFDHTPGTGTVCAVTGQGYFGATAAAHDVNGGTTTLISPPLDATGLGEAWVSYWRWYSNSKGAFPGQDVLEVLVSSSAGGGPWVPVETVGPTGPDTQGGWIRHQFRLADFVAPSATVRLMFVASDLADNSLVEAAIDDLELYDLSCPPGDPASYCTPKPNSLGCLPHVRWAGVPSATSGSAFTISADSVLSQKSGLLFYGLAPASLPFQGGLLCVAGPLKRTPLQSSGGSPPPDDCSGAFSFDFNAWIQSGVDAALVAGAGVHAQYWSREPADPTGFGTSLSDAIAFTIQP
jgi:hypothetical protein